MVVEDRDEILGEIEYQVARMGLECADTYRWTQVEEGIEIHVQKASCCGSWESKYQCLSGTEYFIGCNYGH